MSPSEPSVSPSEPGGPAAGPSAPQPTVAAACDPRTGEQYVPARPYSVDGALVELQQVELAAVGRLTEWVAMGERRYGLVQLAADVRVLAEIADDAPEVGATYAEVGDAPRRFARA